MSCGEQCEHVKIYLQCVLLIASKWGQTLKRYCLTHQSKTTNRLKIISLRIINQIKPGIFFNLKTKTFNFNSNPHLTTRKKLVVSVNLSLKLHMRSTFKHTSSLLHFQLPLTCDFTAQKPLETATKLIWNQLSNELSVCGKAESEVVSFKPCWECFRPSHASSCRFASGSPRRRSRLPTKPSRTQTTSQPCARSYPRLRDSPEFVLFMQTVNQKP